MGAGFQDTKQAVIVLTEELAKLKTVLSNINTQVSKTAKSQEDLKTKQVTGRKAATQLSETEKALNNVRKSQLKNTKQVIAAQEKEKARVKALRDEYKKQNGTLGKSNGLMKSFRMSILSAAAGFVSLQAALTILKSSFSTIVDFEKGMSEVRAITGATVDDFSALQKNALSLGSTTAKTALEVAQLQKEFAKLGFSTSEILSATEATISLSIAAGSDLAESATVAASTIRGFGLSATETGRVVDVMAKSFTSSALDLQKFKTAMAIVAPVAKSAGKDIEFATSQLAVLSDAGLDASTSGTSLRNMFLELNKAGLTWEEGLEKINNSSNKNITALNLFGKRGATAALILADNTEKAGELEIAFDGAAGSAKEMADIMANNLSGDIDKAKSAWEGFILSLNEGSGIISKIGRGAVQQFSGTMTELRQMMQGIASTVREKTKPAIDAYVAEIVKLNGEEKTLAVLESAHEKRLVIIAEKEKELETAKRGKRKELEREIEALKIADELYAENEQIIRDNVNAQTAAIEEAEAARLKIEENYRNKRKALSEGMNLSEVQSITELDEFKVAQNDLMLEYVAEYEKERLKIIDEAAAKELEKKEVLEEQKAALMEQALNTAADVVYSRSSERLDDELSDYQDNLDSKQEAFDDQLEAGTISQEDYDEEIAKLEEDSAEKQAEIERKKALYSIAIDTLLGSIKAIALSPESFGTPFLQYVIAQGAISAAGVAAAAFEHGTDGALKEDTTAWVSEGGQELGVLNGNMFLTPKQKTKAFLPEGTQIFPNYSPETQAVLNGGLSEDVYISEQAKTRKMLSKIGRAKNAVMTDKGIKVNGKTYIDRYRGKQ